jgi:hypothetical protein
MYVCMNQCALVRRGVRVERHEQRHVVHGLQVLPNGLHAVRKTGCIHTYIHTYISLAPMVHCMFLHVCVQEVTHDVPVRVVGDVSVRVVGLLAWRCMYVCMAKPSQTVIDVRGTYPPGL